MKLVAGGKRPRFAKVSVPTLEGVAVSTFYITQVKFFGRVRSLQSLSGKEALTSHSHRGFSPVIQTANRVENR
ncbi:MAG: hypothetical protein ABR568_22635, partial [Pyrinomonadaceae bacterium]